jgi:alcohol dehydrogenase YqhD (iron-dependent ADH family)
VFQLTEDNMTEPQQLTKATGESCGPVAIGSVTGASVEDVEKAIRQAAAEDGENPTHLLDTSFRHQTRAVEMLGFELSIPTVGSGSKRIP